MMIYLDILSRLTETEGVRIYYYDSSNYAYENYTFRRFYGVLFIICYKGDQITKIKRNTEKPMVALIKEKRF